MSGAGLYGVRDMFEVRDTELTGLGVFIKRDVALGDPVSVITGREMTVHVRSVEDALSHPNWVGIGRNRWIDPEWPFVFLNHSCDPNLGIAGDRTLVALRPIPEGHELTLDYSITEVETAWSMTCLCGSSKCRQTIRSIQFLPPAVWEAYLPHINPTFQAIYRRFNALGETPTQDVEATS